MSASVYIVVLNWNRPEETLACIESLNGLRYRDFEVIIVDNGSADDSVRRMSDAWPQLRIIRLDRNLGYGAGNNAGIRRALEAGAQFVWVLNNDAVVEPDSLNLQLEASAESAKIGIITPKILLKRRPDVIWYAGGHFQPRLVRVVRYSAGQFDKGQCDDKRRVNFATGCSLLVKREVFEAIGLFEERYFLYFEDVEFCYRAGQSGWEIEYVPEAIVRHTSGGSSDEPGGRSQQFLYYNTRNLLWFARTHLTPPARFVATAYTFAHLARLSTAIAVGGERDKRVKLLSLGKGVYDGLRGLESGSVEAL